MDSHIIGVVSRIAGKGRDKNEGEDAPLQTTLRAPPIAAKLSGLLTALGAGFQVW
jgi:hypothetical protein